MPGHTLSFVRNSLASEVENESESGLSASSITPPVASTAGLSSASPTWSGEHANASSATPLAPSSSPTNV